MRTILAFAAVLLIAVPARAQAPAPPACSLQSPHPPAAVVQQCDRLLASRATRPEQRAQAHFVRGVLRGATEPEAALEDFAAAARLLPDHPAPHIRSARLLMQLRRPLDAAAAWTEALARTDPTPDLLSERAVAYSEARRMPEALADISAALGLAPDDPDLLSDRAVILGRMGANRRALADLDRLVALAPDNALRRSNRASVRLKLGDLHGAIEDADAIPTAHWVWSRAQATRCIARFRLGDADAQAGCDAAVAASAPGPMRPDWPRTARAGLRLAQGDARAALADADAALANSPGYGFALWLRGLARIALGEDGAADLAAARRADPHAEDGVAAWLPILAR
jgi:tetratricopeptide (TPR) repeat protein